MTQHLWHPCSQMKDYELFKPLFVTHAKGCYLYLKNGQKIIDAIASWWCKSLGHQHPTLKKALSKQLEKFEHVILANTTNRLITTLSAQLCELMPNLRKVFYAGDGSCAVEIALKMSLHSRKIQGEVQRNQFVALKNGYHGETIGAMSVSDVGLYKYPYQDLLFKTHFISNIPYVTGIEDPLWQNCSAHWLKIERSLSVWQDKITAIILEPIVQGAGGMKIYSQDFLKKLRQWTKKHNIHLIADEIMTGIGRTGKLLACQHAGIDADFVCLSKGLTGGFLPFSAVLTTDDIYAIFYDDYAKNKHFLHSHTYTGNALGASVALAVLKIFSQKKTEEYIHRLGKTMLKAMQAIQENTGHKIKHIRQIGGIIATDLNVKNTHQKSPPTRRLGFEIYQEAVKRGALLRPLGNTLYWLPPLNTPLSVIARLQKITQEAILAVDFE